MQLCRSTGRERDLARSDFKGDDPRITLRWSGAAGGNPFTQHLVFERARFEPLSAAVTNRHCRLEQQQAPFRFEQVDAPARRLTGHDVEISLRIIAAQRQLEPALASQRPVTGARVAAEPGQYRNNVVAKVPATNRRRHLIRRLRRVECQWLDRRGRSADRSLFAANQEPGGYKGERRQYQAQ